MKYLSGLAIAAVLLCSAAIATPVLAVDNTISDYCTLAYADSGYQRPGGYCEQVADWHSLLRPQDPPSCSGGKVWVPKVGCVLPTPV